MTAPMDDLIDEHLQADDPELEERWAHVEAWVGKKFGRDASIEAILFLIGIQSLGRGYQPELVKEAKQDAIMEGTYCAFEMLGLYERIGLDERGHWIWERSVESIPKLPVEQQEKLLKLGIVRYFDGVFEDASGTPGDAPSPA